MKFSSSSSSLVSIVLLCSFIFSDASDGAQEVKNTFSSVVDETSSIRVLISSSDGSCKTSSDCAPGYCCSNYNFCGTGPAYCGSTPPRTAPPTAASSFPPPSTAVHSPPPLGLGSCKTSSDCAPGYCCSNYNFCGTGPDFCGSTPPPTAPPTAASSFPPPSMAVNSPPPPTTKVGSPPPPTTKVGSPPPLSFGSCKTSSDCAPGYCCSKYNYCGTGPDYCGSTPPTAVGSLPPPPVPSSSPAPSLPNRKKASSVPVIVGVVGAVLVLMLAAAVVFWCYAKKGRQKRGMAFQKELGALALQNFTRRQILAATANFSDTAIIGKGGYGTVYLAHAPDGTPWAVKRVKVASQETLTVFENEVKLIASVRHKNLVALLGYHCQGGEQVLVYELVPNGTLQSHINLERRTVPLTFQQRLEILVGVARGISYLHNFANDPIVHRDIKSSNILLDDDLQPKVADFGLSKAMKGEEAKEHGLLGAKHHNTHAAGTPGYMDPDYYRTFTVTVKSDVYSFGVVMLELLTGKPAVMYDADSSETVGLARWAYPFLVEENFGHVADPVLGANLPAEKFKVVACVAKMCIAPLGKDRPSMAQITRYLEAAQGSTLLFDQAGAGMANNWDFIDVSINEILAETSASSSGYLRAPISESFSGR